MLTGWEVPRRSLAGRLGGGRRRNTMRRGKKLRLGIIFGGRSAEHEVSIQSARNIIAAADPKKYDVVPIVITREGRWCVGALPPASGAHEAIEIGRAHV